MTKEEKQAMAEPLEECFTLLSKQINVLNYPQTLFLLFSINWFRKNSEQKQTQLQIYKALSSAVIGTVILQLYSDHFYDLSSYL